MNSDETIHVIKRGSDHATWCKHYRGMHGHTTCEAGVAFETVRLDGQWKYSYDKGQTIYTSGACYPCLGGSNFGGATCEKQEFPTKEEVEAEEREIAELFSRTTKARAAIVEHLGPWKKGTPGAGGAIDCPVCNGDKTLRFSRAGINGHIHAACATDGCVRWME